MTERVDAVLVDVRDRARCAELEVAGQKAVVAGMTRGIRSFALRSELRLPIFLTIGRPRPAPS